MAFDLAKIRKQLEGALLASPYPFELSAAVVSDTFRLAGLTPPGASTWKSWRTAKRPNLEDQLGMLAHALLTTELREDAVDTLLRRPIGPVAALPAFFQKVEPLTGEMIRANVFRQEEFLRRFIEAIGGEIRGESARASQARLDQLDYNKTLKEYARAENARKAEAEKRAKLLEEARQREAAARGWRE